MAEVSGPIIAIALVLCAVFIPIAFISGLTGQFFRQFALTIAFSTLISAFNSLTLSPALAAILLRPHGAPPDRATRVIDRLFGWAFGPFNRFFERSSASYGRTVTRLTRRSGIALAVYGGLIALTVFGFAKVPTGFVPTQDKQYLIAFAQLPDASTLDRTEDVVKRMSRIGLENPSVAHAIAFPGLSINGFVNAPNSGIVFFSLKDFDERTKPEEYGPAVAAALTQQLGSIQDAYIAVFPPPPVNGIGTMGGFKLQLEDRMTLGDAEMNAALQPLLQRANADPALAGVFSGFQTNVPQLFADVDREKAKRQGIALTDVFQTLQVYLGSSYVNDFSRFGRTYRVVAQADAPFRADADAVTRLQVRNAAGEMVPLGSLMTVRQVAGPDRVVHYNAYPSAEINGAPAPGHSSDQATAAMERIAREVLPNGIGYEWTDLKYQQILAGNTAIFVMPLCVLLAFLVLAAQYESWTLPLAVILIVPMTLLSAIMGVWASRSDNNIFTQVGLVVLVGLACKNAILIVEFARELEERGMTPVAAALEAARLRLRPILMTSLAFVMGVVPLVLSHGAGAEMRHAMGVAVFSGMLGVTFFGLLLTPVFYVVLRTLAARKAERTVSAPTPLQLPGDALAAEAPTHA
jgi:multidrug efflux pump